jgi:hypothetical protein
MNEERQMKFYWDLMATVGLDPNDAGGHINFTGPTDPIYDSPYYLAEGTAAIFGAIGTAVAQIWRMRGGEEQDITVNRLHAVQALHRVNFLKQNGYPIILTAPFNSTGLTHRCRDGRFFEATTTTRHLEIAMLDLLDCANNDAACREAYMKWDAFALEDAVAHHNLCGTVHHPRRMAQASAGQGPDGVAGHHHREDWGQPAGALYQGGTSAIWSSHSGSRAHHRGSDDWQCLGRAGCGRASYRLP